MNYKKILLIKPDYLYSHYEYAGLPAGLGYISEILDNHHIDQEVVDMSLGYNYNFLKKRIRAFRPDLIGITMMSYRFKDHYALLESIKKDFKDIAIAAGGPHISTFRQKALLDCNAIDYGITLEGEDAIIDLCKTNKPLKEIKGLLYRENNNVLYTQDREFRNNLEEIGFPRYRFFERKKYPQFISLVTSRGCPHSCIFCPVKLTIGRKLRLRSSDSVIKEIDYWRKEGIKIFNIVDDNFTFMKQRVLDICQGIRNMAINDLTLSCRNGIRADTVDREVLAKMREAGFNYLAFGVESGSQRILDILKKGETLIEMENAVKAACDLGFMVTLFFLLGSPYETKEDIYKSLDFAKKFPVFDARFYNLIPFPGTELYTWIKNNNYFSKDSEDFLNSGSHWINKPIFSTPELPFDIRKKIYADVNAQIKKHTIKTKILFAKDMERLFKGLGIPVFLSKPLARIYYTPLFQKIIIGSGLALKIRKILTKK